MLKKQQIKDGDNCCLLIIQSKVQLAKNKQDKDHWDSTAAEKVLSYMHADMSLQYDLIVKYFSLFSCPGSSIPDLGQWVGG